MLKVIVITLICLTQFSCISSPSVTQTGSSGNNQEDNITGSDNSNIDNTLNETRDNSGAGLDINIGCTSNVNVASPNSEETIQDVNCDNTNNSSTGGQ